MLWWISWLLGPGLETILVLGPGADIILYSSTTFVMDWGILPDLCSRTEAWGRLGPVSDVSTLDLESGGPGFRITKIVFIVKQHLNNFLKVRTRNMMPKLKHKFSRFRCKFTQISKTKVVFLKMESLHHERECQEQSTVCGIWNSHPGTRIHWNWQNRSNTELTILILSEGYFINIFSEV